MIELIASNAKQLKSYIRLTPFDCSNEEGRGNERYRRASLTAITSAIAKAVSILTILVSVPLTLNYLGSERYGLWMTISSLIAMLTFADLGLGNGLMNVLSDALGRDNDQDLIHSVSSAFYMLSGVALGLGGIFSMLYRYVPWSHVYNINSPLALAEAGPATIVFVCCFLLSLPLGIVQRVQMGYQEGYNTSLWAILGSLTGLILMLLVIHLKGGLPWLILAISGTQVLALLLNSLFMLKKRPRLKPSPYQISSAMAGRILRLGILFFILQGAMAVAYASDNIVAAQILGPEAVTQYSVPYKLFAIIPIAAGTLLNPLWPAYTESLARGDTLWVRKTLARSIKLTLIVTLPLVVILAVFCIPILHFWAGPQINPPVLLVIGLALWAVIGTIGNAIAMFLNGANIIRFQVITASLMACGAIILKIVLAKTIGVSGIIWGIVISYSLFSIIPSVCLVPGILRGMDITEQMQLRGTGS